MVILVIKKLNGWGLTMYPCYCKDSLCNQNSLKFKTPGKEHLVRAATEVPFAQLAIHLQWILAFFLAYLQALIINTQI